MQSDSRSLSRYALWLCWLIMFLSAFFFYPRWKNSGTEATLSWDVSGYYMYLPATFIYHDLKQCSFRDSVLKRYQPTPDFQQAIRHEGSGHYVMKYSCGQALVMLPMFLAAHCWALASEAYPADGFSYPYQLAIGVGMWLLACIGLYFLRKILRFYFKDAAVAWTLLLLVAGSNYLNYTTVDQAMTHNALFTLYTLIIWTSIRFHQKQHWKPALLVGFLCGLVTLIRPTEIIAVLIPLLWGISTRKDFKERFFLFVHSWRLVLVFAIAFALVLSLQVVYWKWVSGAWVVYSYGGQGFTWLHPHIKDYLFSFRCGWLLYAPLMGVPLFLLIFYFFKGPQRLAITGITLVAFYLVTAWDVWDYGGTAGRAMVQYYTLLAFPLCWFVEGGLKHRIPQITLSLFSLLFIYFNFWWTWQAHYGPVKVSEVSYPYYFKTLGRWSVPEYAEKWIENNYVYTNELRDSVEWYRNSFEQDGSELIHSADGASWLELDANVQNSPEYRVSVTGKKQSRVRVRARFAIQDKEWDLWKQTQFIMKFYFQGQEVFGQFLRVHRFLNPGDEKYIFMDAECPQNWDELRVSFWNAGSPVRIRIDDLTVTGFEEK